MRRWSFRILIAFAILLAVVIVVTQAVLSFTDMPDRIVLTEVQQQLGLRMTAKSVDTGWFGTTTIKDVTLALPLAQESLLATPELRVRHTWLPRLLLTRKVEIDLLTLEDAQLVVRQDAAGRWNVQDLVELLARTGGKQQAVTTATKRSGPRLPGVLIHNGTVTVTDQAGRVAKLSPLEFSGLPDAAAPGLIWRYDAKVAPILKAVGQLSPGFEWAHQVDFDVTNGGDVLRPWLGVWAEPLNLAGRWEGELKSGQAIGRLTLAKMQALGVDVSGVVRARAGGGTARIEPQKLVIKTPQNLLPELQVSSGAIELIGTTVSARRVQVSALAGVAQVDGRWAMDQDVGELVATWDEIQQPGGVRHGGRLSAAVTNTLGQPSVKADLASNGTYRGGRWRTQMNLTGGGRAWSEMNWVATAPNLSWDGPPRNVRLDGLVAHLATHGDVLELASVQLPSAERVSGRGSIDFASKRWALNLSGRGWPVPQLPPESTLEFRLDGAGDFTRYKLNDLYLKTGDAQIAGSGSYDRAIPKPLELDLRINHLAVESEADPTLRGNLRADAHVSGVAWPLSVGLSGKVFGEALRVKGRRIGDVTIDVEGSVTQSQANLTSKELALLGGHWSLVGTWLKEKDLARLTVKVRDLPLSEVGVAAGRDDVSGTMQGAWTFDLPNFDRARLSATGDFDARQVRVGAFPVERATGKLAMQNGRVEISPIDLTQGKGTAKANVSLAITSPKRPNIGLTAKDWPVDLPAAGASLSISTDAKLELDLESRRATGPLTARADVTLGEQPLGQARVAADFSGHAVRFTSIEADAFAGTATGSGNFDLDNPLTATGELTWRDIDATSVASIFPRLTGLAGRFGGSAKIAPANDPRTLEPLRLDIVLDSYGGNYRNTPVGDGTLTAFMNYQMSGTGKPGAGDRYRIVLSDTQEDPSFLRVADGIVRIWGRFTRHRGVTQPGGQVTLDLDRLSIDQVVHVYDPKAEPMPGRLSGTLNVYGNPSDRTRLSGLGSLRITESDLVNLDAFTVLYDSMNVLGGAKDATPRGYGSAELRFEADTLYLNNVRYFNRKTEIRAAAVISKVWSLPHSPIDGTAVGSVALSNIDLPLLADVDDVLNVLQREVTSAVVSGMVNDPKVQVVPFGDISASMRSFLLGDVQAAEK